MIYPNQFLLTNVALDHGDPTRTIYEWQGVNLLIHPDFKSHLILQEDFIFYGDVFSYEQPEWSSHSILNAINWSADKTTVLKALSKLSGWFILWFKNQGQWHLVNDATGQYECYWYAQNGDIIFSNQPHYMKEAMASTQEIADDTPQYIRDTKVNIFNFTAFKHIQKLTPNHYWDGHQKAMIRFYPWTQHQQKPLEEVSKVVSHRLERIMQSMAHRRPLAVGLTAGWDSRVLLAACQSVMHRVDLYTMDLHTNDSKIDIQVALEMAKVIGKPLKIIDTHKVLDKPAYHQAVYHSDDLAHQLSRLSDMQSFDCHYIINGNVSEIAKNFYQPLPNIQKASELAYISRFKETQYETERFDDWLRQWPKQEYQLLDFLYWEHKMPNWAGRYRSISNLYQTTLSPFNNRILLDDMLSVSSKHRSKHRNALYQTMVNLMWPLLNRFPINPTPKDFAIRQLSQWGLYKYYRMLFFRYRKLKF